MQSKGRALDSIRWTGSMVLLAALVACGGSKHVMVDGVQTARQEHEFTGQPYQVRHREAHPRPGGPSDGLRAGGGHITGQVCGLSINYDVQHKGDHIQLIGFIEGDRSSQISVRDQGEQRIISGSLSPQTDSGGSLGVDLTLTKDALEGIVGLRIFKLKEEGDTLTGVVKIQRWGGPLPAKINGLAALRALPPADQAAILPALLTCGVPGQDQGLPSPLVVGFGGKPTVMPALSSSVYNPNR